jgi:hypothetical protein
MSGNDHFTVGRTIRCAEWDEMFYREKLEEYGGECPWCGQPLDTEGECNE